MIDETSNTLNQATDKTSIDPVLSVTEQACTQNIGEDKLIYRNKCILTGVDITNANDSKAHIIARALGGRLKSKGILSSNGNSILDRKVDNPHIQAMQPYMTLLNGSRDRGGKSEPIPTEDNVGKRYMSRANEVKPLDHEYNVVNVGGKPTGTIKATTMKQAKQLVGKTQKEFKLTDDEIMEVLKTAQIAEEPPGPLNIKITAGPAVEFPSAFTMAALFCAYKGLPVRSDFVNYIESLDENVSPRPLPPETFYFIHKDAWFKLNAEVGHCLILYGDPVRKQAIFFSQLFGLLGIAVLIPYAGSEPVCHTYGVDILEGRDASVYVNTAALCGLDWKETHRLGDAALYVISEECSKALTQVARNRAFTQASQDILNQHLAEKDMNAPMSKEEKTALYSDICKFLKLSVKPEFLDQALLGLKQEFDKLGGVDE